MADTAIAITAGSGTNVDTRTEATNGNHRQVVVIGDPSVNAGVAPVDVTNGLSVNVTNASLTVASHAVTNAGTFATQAAQSGTWTVQPGNTANTTAWKVDGSAVTQPISMAAKTIVSKSGSASTSGNNTIVAAGTNKLKVFAFSLSTSSTTALTVKFQDGASGTDLWSVILQAPASVTTGANLAISPPNWLFNTSAATLLNLNLSSANAVQWSVSYFDEA